MTDEVELLHNLAQNPELLAQVRAGGASELAHQSQLRACYPGELVRAAFELDDLRRRAATKFPQADQMWFDRTGLEQATSQAVAQHKAARFAGRTETVWDLCCGIGSDAIALAQRGLTVNAVDLSAAACLRTDWNAELHNVSERVRSSARDVREVNVAGEWVHIDPDRRTTARRAIRLEDYEPGLDWLMQLSEIARGGAIKLSPASNFGGNFAGSEIELTSLAGECKEATVWFGELHSGAIARATVLPAGETLSGDPREFRPVIRDLQTYLYDPDPAIVRAGLVDALCASLDLGRLDDAEEYLTSGSAIHSPFVSGFEILAELPNNERQIRNYFRDHPCGEVEIKARHVPVQVEALRKHIPRTGTGRLTLLIARLQGKTRALVARRIVHA